MIVIFWE